MKTHINNNRPSGSRFDGADQDKHKPRTFWSGFRFTDPTEGVCAAPLFDLCPGIQDLIRERSGANPMSASDGGIFIFDMDFIDKAPPEAIEAAVAMALADAFTRAAGPRSSDPDELADQVEQIATRWGFYPDDLAAWVASTIAAPTSGELLRVPLRALPSTAACVCGPGHDKQIAEIQQLSGTR